MVYIKRDEILIKVQEKISLQCIVEMSLLESANVEYKYWLFNERARKKPGGCF